MVNGTYLGASGDLTFGQRRRPHVVNRVATPPQAAGVGAALVHRHGVMERHRAWAERDWHRRPAFSIAHEVFGHRMFCAFSATSRANQAPPMASGDEVQAPFCV